MVPNIGSWISPSGIDLTNSTIDPFDVLVGGREDPGSLVIQQRSGHLISSSFQGVYRCIIEDEMQQQNYLLVGIYATGFSSKSNGFNLV